MLIPLLQHYKLVVVYDSDHKLIGQVSAGDLLKKYQPENGIESAIEKVITIEADERVVHLRRRMLDDNITRFVVSDQGKYIGIVTETDVAVAMRKFRKSVRDQHQDHRIRNMIVRDIMTAPLISVDTTASVSEVIDLMLKKNISSVPVVDKGRLAGIITRRSLVNALVVHEYRCSPHRVMSVRCAFKKETGRKARQGKRGGIMAVQLLVKDVMVKPVTISKSQSINEALDKMLNENSDPLIVLAGHQVVGTVSRKSIADKLGSKHKATISTAKIHVASSLEENIPSVSTRAGDQCCRTALKKA